MKKNLFATLCVFTILFLVSCQKEASFQQENRTTANDSILLARYVELDTTLPAPFDTVYMEVYKYDGLKRCISGYYGDVSGNIFDTIGTFEMFYHGNDTLPYKTFDFDHIDSWDFTSFLYYDNQAKIIKDSTLTNYFGPQTEITTYTYLPNAVKRHSKSIDDQGNISYYDHTTYYTRNGNNILTQTDTTVDWLSGTSYILSLNYTYDNHPNPYRSTEKMFTIRYGGEDLASENRSTNNFKSTYTERKILNVPDPIDIDDVSYTYEYRADGYPRIVRYTDEHGQTTKALYLYTK